MQIARKRGYVFDVHHMRFTVQHRLIQMRDAPALRHVELKQLRQLLRRLARRRVAPRAKRRQQPVVPVKRQIPVHHGGDANRTDLRQPHAMSLPHLLAELPETVLYPRPCVLQIVGPVSALQPVLPVMRPVRQHRMILADQHRLDPRRSQFDPQRGCGEIEGLVFPNQCHISLTFQIIKKRAGDRTVTSSNRTAHGSRC
ncbi:hypothetical protein SDC9_114980 [bioreactor metagenome]|uniref:Uncharacterized protein n=1 Tax=bioreactor metagenome TaxID=1076179 RepID=A0A645C257_9ZZZZ